VLKLSGEALAEPTGFGLDNNVLTQVATEVREAGHTCQVVDLFSKYTYQELENIP
jgi:uridylate kinase